MICGQPVVPPHDWSRAGDLRISLGEVRDGTFGPTPGWEEVVEWLCGEETIMKTACAALLEIEAATWHEAVNNDGGWDLIEVIRPRDLSDA